MRGQLLGSDVELIVRQLISEGIAAYVVAHWIAGVPMILPRAIMIAAEAGGELTLEAW